MAARKKSEWAWMRYLAYQVFVKKMHGEALQSLFAEARAGKGLDFVYALARQHAEKTSKTCPERERFHVDYLHEKGLEGVFIVFPNNRPYAADLKVAVIRIAGQPEAVFFRFSLILVQERIFEIIEALPVPAKALSGPFCLQEEEARLLLNSYIAQNLEQLVEGGEES